MWGCPRGSCETNHFLSTMFQAHTLWKKCRKANSFTAPLDRWRRPRRPFGSGAKAGPGGPARTRAVRPTPLRSCKPEMANAARGRSLTVAASMRKPVMSTLLFLLLLLRPEITVADQREAPRRPPPVSFLERFFLPPPHRPASIRTRIGAIGSRAVWGPQFRKWVLPSQHRTPGSRLGSTATSQSPVLGGGFRNPS